MVKIIKDNNEYYEPDNISLMKMHILQKFGKWKVNLIYFEDWNNKYQTKTKKEDYMRKCFE